MSPPKTRATETLAPQPWTQSAATRAVIDALAGGPADGPTDGTDVRFVGGCVRDALIGRPVADIDIATPDRPETVIEKLEAAGLKAIPTGIEHGTVTAVSKGRPFEITTLRRDVETDGRHAVVAFTDDWAEDAARRDFTMNAISLSPDGTIHDPGNGIPDLRAGRVRFVGDADARITEDVLRLLRFYRFHAHYGEGAPDPDAVAACRRHADKLPGLSAERVRVELLKLLAAPEPAPVIEMMRGDGVLEQILPADAGTGLLAALSKIEAAPDPVRRLAALLPADPGIVADAAGALRLSNLERDRLVAIAGAAPGFDLPADDRARRAALYRLGAPLFSDLVHLAAARDPGGVAALAAELAAAEAWERPELPVTGQDLVDAGIEKGPAVGEALRELEQKWIDSDFTADRRTLLSSLDQT